jgi:AcrR family transcriptional regulator
MQDQDHDQPTRADARRNRELLLGAAREAFAAQGPDAPLDGIARRAGLGSGTLYRHFPTRDALMRAVYRDEIEGLCTLAREGWDAPSPGEALVAWLRSLAARTGRQGLAAALMASMPDVSSQFIEECHTAIDEAAGPLLRRAQEAGTVRADLTLRELLGVVHAITSGSGPDQVDRRLSLLLEGIRAPR